jgi:hypothetical protein
LTIIVPFASGTKTFALPSLGRNGLLLLGREDIQFGLLSGFRSRDGFFLNGGWSGELFDGGNLFDSLGAGRGNVSGRRGSDDRGGFWGYGSRCFNRCEWVLVFTRSGDDCDGGGRVGDGGCRGGSRGAGTFSFAASQARAAGAAEGGLGEWRRGGRGGFGRSSGRFIG